MEKSAQYIAHLLLLKEQSLLTAEQDIELQRWAGMHAQNQEILRRAENKVRLAEDLATLSAIDAQGAWKKLQIKINKEKSLPVSLPTRRHTVLLKWTAAACLLMSVSFLAYYFYQYGDEKIQHPMGVKIDLPPGHSGALLTLKNGQQVSLDSMQNGNIDLKEGNHATVIDGVLVYDANEGAPVENLVSTPNSRQYALTLSDGTKVWLNAASSIRFPTKFSGNQRRVVITGEAYLEVAKNKKMPFVVTTDNGLKIEVLGTHFNINSYSDEKAIKTTLFEGAVVTSYGKATATLAPGQQSVAFQTTDNSHKISVQTANDMDAVTAWKDGLFNFTGMDFKMIMRQLERWYNIKVYYEGAVPQLRFFGEISRNENLSDVLTALQESGIQFNLDKERRLTVLKK